MPYCHGSLSLPQTPESDALGLRQTGEAGIPEGRPASPYGPAAALGSLSSVALAVLDQKRTVSGAQGPLGDFSITNFSRSEALEEAIVADVTAKLAVFEEWHEVT